MIDSDILADFQAETKGLLAELEDVVEKLEEQVTVFPAGELEQFAQRIDRIMGAAQTLAQFDASHQGLKRIGGIAQLCKKLGYTASQLKLPALVPIFAGFWADTLEVLGELVDAVGDEAKTKQLTDSFSSVLQNRLTWLSEKVQKLAPAGISAGAPLSAQLDVDQLLANFGK
jgi:hypothetical protein